MLVQRGNGGDLVDWFFKALKSTLAVDEAQGIELKYSHGRGKYGTTKYTLIRRIDLYQKQSHQFKAYGDREAIEYANGYIQVGKWRGKIYTDWDVNTPI